MAQATLYNLAGQNLGQVDLDDAVFGIEPNTGVMHEAVVAHLRNCRQGTVNTKGRGEISGGGKKPWRQKGTGHARQGTTRAPHWRHGGVVFGPKPRDLHRSLPDKVSKLARKSALSAKLIDGELRLLDNLSIEGIKTARIVRALNDLGFEPGDSALFVASHSPSNTEEKQTFYLSCRNIPNVTVCTTETLSAYDIIRNRHVFVEQGAVARIVEVLCS